MNSLDEARARSSAYVLLSQLYLGGLTIDLLDHVLAIPELADAVSRPFDADEAAAAHQHLFGFNVFAHESVFLDAANILGGPVTAAVLELYSQVGYRASRSALAPDHAGIELDLLAFLCAAEADAWQDGEAGQAHRMRAVQRRFLDQHLLVWLAALGEATRQQGIPFYAALADLTWELVSHHRATLATGSMDLAWTQAPPAPAGLLDEGGTGLNDIAGYLLTPCYSGLYLSRDDIGRLGRPYRLPRGFGDRRQMLANLLRSAVTYDSLAGLLDDLRALVQQWRSVYTPLLDSPAGPVPGIAAAWLERLAGTDLVLERLQAAGS